MRWRNVRLFAPPPLHRAAAVALSGMALLSGGALFQTAGAGTISGTIRDAATLAPLAGIDLDVFDDRFRLDPSITTISGVDGSYTLVGVNGPVFVRADATLAQGKVDQYYPGSFEPAGAQLLQVGSNDNITAIDFALVGGVPISGSVTTTEFGAPLANCDLDVFALDGSFLSGIDAMTLADGSYTFGLFPPGQYVVKADPSLLQGYVPQFHPNSFGFAGALAISVGSTPVAGVDFLLEPGGQIVGRVIEEGSLAPAEGADIDVFGAAFTPLPQFGGTVDVLGDYTTGIIPVGSYYILADALFDQPWVDTFYGQTPFIALATPVTVNKGMLTGGIDITVPRLGFISGTITDAVTGLPVAGMDIDLTSTAGVYFPQYDAQSGPDGSYRIGPLPPGVFRVRADATTLDPYADQYFPGVFSPAAAAGVSVGDSVLTGIDFALVRGGWIRGSISRVADAMPLAGIDLDIFLPDGTPIPSVDADSDSLGNYRIGAVPFGTYLLRADPLPTSGYQLQYYSGADTITAATAVQVLVGLDTAGIDFALDSPVLTATPTTAISFAVVALPHPNPFSARTSLRFRSGRDMPRRLSVYDTRGRRVRNFELRARPAGEEFDLHWDGRDDRGKSLASGTYFLQLGTDSHAQAIKLLKVR